MFKVTQESPGDFTAQGLHELRDPALLQGSNLAAHTGSIPTTPHPCTPLFPLPDNLGLKVIREGCHDQQDSEMGR